MLSTVNAFLLSGRTTMGPCRIKYMWLVFNKFAKEGGDIFVQILIGASYSRSYPTNMRGMISSVEYCNFSNIPTIDLYHKHFSGPSMLT